MGKPALRVRGAAKKKGKKGKEKGQKKGVSLEAQMSAARLAKPLRPSRRPQTLRRQQARAQADSTQQLVSERLTAKIIKEALKQREEINVDNDDALRSSSSGGGGGGKRVRLSTRRSDDDDARLSDGDAFDGDDANYDDGILELDAEEEAAVERFLPASTATRRTLADLIQEKIAQKNQQIQQQLSETGGVEVRELDGRLEELYGGVGQVLAGYRSGRLPKAFKVIPKLVNWEQMLQLTRPDHWTPAALYQATRIFASNLNAKMSQRFYNLVLLPRVRDDIAENKKLNFHLYQALRKSLFKPAAFFKGILLPLCEANCTLREATIVGSVLARWSVPSLQAAAAMVRLSEAPYAGANSLFLRLLIDKKYTLPFRVIDALIAHFLRFAMDERPMTVLWHQCLLALCQRYKTDLSSEQRDALLDLIKIHSHHQMSAEIRRELQSAVSREAEDATDALSTVTPIHMH